MTDLATAERHSTVLFMSGLDSFKPVQKWTQPGDSSSQRFELSGVPVFRSGTFRNSMGEQATWEGLHISQMVDNFQLLQNKGTFQQAPIRRGHGALFSDPMDSLVGWVTGLSTVDQQNPVDGQTYTYLLADISLFDQQAAERVSAGDWPNRSAEVGTYVNNNEAEYWPMFMGFAYVDIPAVEGLNFSKFQKDTNVLFDNPKEFGVTGQTTPPAPPAPPAAPQQHSFTIAGAVCQDFGRVQAYITELEGFKSSHQPAKFSLRGAETTDVSAVQAHITTLEEFEKESKTSGRKDFITSLAAGPAPKIQQSQVESLQALAVSMGDDQFSIFKKSYEELPANPLFGQFGNQNAGVPLPGAPAGQPTPGSIPGQTASESRYSIVKEQVTMHQRAGKTQAQIEKMPSYIEMKALEAAGQTA